MMMPVEALRKFLRELSTSKDGDSFSAEMVNIHDAVAEEMSDTHIFVPIDVNKSKAIAVQSINFYFKPKKDFGKLLLDNFEEVVYKIATDEVWDYLDGDKFMTVDINGKPCKQFKDLRNGYFVNMLNVKNYDSYKNEVYFKNGTSLGVVGGAIKSVLPKYLGKEKDLNKAKAEYAPLRNSFNAIN